MGILDNYTKYQLHEAFTIEQYWRKRINKELNIALRVSAAHRYDAHSWREKWLKEHIQNNIEVVGDMQEALNAYFKHKNKILLMTDNDGYYAAVENKDHIFIVFAWKNEDAPYWREHKAMIRLIKELVSYGKPIRYVGLINVMWNHSAEISKGLFELKF